MGKAPDNFKSAEQLKEVASFLKQADKYVREGNYSAALEEIAKARARDPRNLYALAYEERVRSLVIANKEKKPETAPASSPVQQQTVQPQSVPAALEHISNLAIVEAQRAAAVAEKREQELLMRKKAEEEHRRNEELRRQAIETKISTFLKRANDYLEKGEYDRALDEIARAYLLDPANERVHSTENQIRKAQKEAILKEEQERFLKQQAEERRRQELLKAQIARIQQEKEERRRREEEARRIAQQQKVSQYLQKAKECYENGKYDEALSELAFVVVIDPLNEEVLALERKIRDAQEREQAEQLEQYRRREEEQRKKREAIMAAIQKHIENAEKLASQGKWSEALRVITRAYVLDPVNEALQACEKRILAAQEEAMRVEEERRRLEEEAIRKRQEEELRKLEQAERERALLGESAETEAKRRSDKEKILAYLAKARTYMSEGRYEDALGEVALAFIVNPFDEDIKQMEQEIIAAQEKKKAEEEEELRRQQEAIRAEEIAREVAELLAEASRLASEKEYSKALDEVAKAFVLDPLNDKIQQFEAQLQKEFQEYQEEKRRKEEEEEKRNAVNLRIRRAKEFLERETFDEALAEVAEGYTYDPNNSELKALEQQIRNSYARWKEKQAEEERNKQIEDYLSAAKSQLTKELFDDALETIRKAIALDPKRETLKSMESEIIRAKDAWEKRKQKEKAGKDVEKHIFKAKESRLVRNYKDAIAELDQALALDPENQDIIELKNQVIEEEKRWKLEKEQSEKESSLKEHIKEAREFFAKKAFEEALMEIAVGLSIDPGNKELLALEEEVRKAQIESDEAKEEESELMADEKSQLIWIHLHAADEFQKQKEFAKALDEIAKAYTIDPLNPEIKKAEARIRQNEARYAQQTGQTLKLIYPDEKAIGGKQ